MPSGNPRGKKVLEKEQNVGVGGWRESDASELVGEQI